MAELEQEAWALMRLQTVAGGNVVGEIGLYLGTLRTSTVVCDTPCVLYRLSAAALAQMRTAEPDLAAAVHAHIAGVMAERLIHTIRALDAAEPVAAQAMRPHMLLANSLSGASAVRRA